MNKRKQKIVRELAEQLIEDMMKNVGDCINEVEYYTKAEMNHSNYDERLAYENLYNAVVVEIRKQLS